MVIKACLGLLCSTFCSSSPQTSMTNKSHPRNFTKKRWSWGLTPRFLWSSLKGYSKNQRFVSYSKNQRFVSSRRVRGNYLPLPVVTQGNVLFYSLLSHLTLLHFAGACGSSPLPHLPPPTLARAASNPGHHGKHSDEVIDGGDRWSDLPDDLFSCPQISFLSSPTAHEATARLC